MSVVEDFQKLEAHASRLIIGQAHLINRMLIALLCDGHLLVEGAPGLAKTRAIKVLAESIEGDFHRLQFTPDLLPADLTGTDIYRPQEGTFEFRRGPLFHNLILADEINRAPAKVQSALLEAMEERQITVGERSYALDDLFMVMATQNPIEQEGTYPLPEAQLDRFLLHVQVAYPTPEDERRILVLNRDEAKAGERDPFQPPEELSAASIMQARQDILGLHLAEELEEYIVNVVVATRNPGAGDESLDGRLRAVHLHLCRENVAVRVPLRRLETDRDVVVGPLDDECDGAVRADDPFGHRSADRAEEAGEHGDVPAQWQAQAVTIVRADGVLATMTRFC